MKTLDVHVGGALRYERLAVFPIFVSTDSPVAYRLGAEAARAGRVGLVQRPDGGPQPPQPPIVENREDVRVLLPAGMPLPGSTAHPVLHASVLLPPRSKIRIPAEYLGPEWATMASRQRPATDVPARTLAECKQRLAYPDQAAGVAAAIGRRLIAVELFDQPAACRQIWGDCLTIWHPSRGSHRPMVGRRRSTFSGCCSCSAKPPGSGRKRPATATCTARFSAARAAPPRFPWKGSCFIFVASRGIVSPDTPDEPLAAGRRRTTMEAVCPD